MKFTVPIYYRGVIQVSVYADSVKQAMEKARCQFAKEHPTETIDAAGVPSTPQSFRSDDPV